VSAASRSCNKRIRLQETLQKSLINPAAEALTAVDDNDRHAITVAISQLRIGVDIDFLEG